MTEHTTADSDGNKQTERHEHLLDDLIEGFPWSMAAQIKIIRNEDVNYEKHLGLAKAIYEADDFLGPVKVYLKFMQECDQRDEKELAKRVKRGEIPLGEGVKYLQDEYPETWYIDKHSPSKQEVEKHLQEEAE